MSGTTELTDALKSKAAQPWWSRLDDATLHVIFEALDLYDDRTDSEDQIRARALKADLRAPLGYPEPEPA